MTNEKEEVEEILAYVKNHLDYDKDSGKFFWKSNSREAGATVKGYRVIKINNKTIPLHHLVWIVENKRYPKMGYIIDHINHNREDNRIENLREITPAENSKNMKLNAKNTSGFNGVRWHKHSNSWYAYINEDGEEISLGYFKTKEEAIKARLEANKKYGYHENHGLPLDMSAEEFMEHLNSVAVVEETKDDKVVNAMEAYQPESLEFTNISRPLSFDEHYIAEQYAKGFTPQAIAVEMGKTKGAVQRILNRKDVKEVVSELVRSQYTTMKEGRLRILNKIIDDKLALFERSGGNLALSTKKDVVDLIALMDNMLKEEEKASLGTTEDTYITIINSVLDD